MSHATARTFGLSRTHTCADAKAVQGQSQAARDSPGGIIVTCSSKRHVYRRLLRNFVARYALLRLLTGETPAGLGDADTKGYRFQNVLSFVKTRDTLHN